MLGLLTSLLLYFSLTVHALTPGFTQQRCFPIREPSTLKIATLGQNSSVLVYRAIDALNHPLIPQLKGYDFRSRYGADNPLKVCNDTLVTERVCHPDQLGSFILDDDNFALINQFLGSIQPEEQSVEVPIYQIGVYCTYISTTEVQPLGDRSPNKDITDVLKMDPMDSWYNVNRTNISYALDGFVYEGYIIWLCNLVILVGSSHSWVTFWGPHIQDEGVKWALIIFWACWVLDKVIVCGGWGALRYLLCDDELDYTHSLDWSLAFEIFVQSIRWLFLLGTCVPAFDMLTPSWFFTGSKDSDSQSETWVGMCCALVIPFYSSIYLGLFYYYGVDYCDVLSRGFRDNLLGNASSCIFYVCYLSVYVGMVWDALRYLERTHKATDEWYRTKCLRSVYTAVSVHLYLYGISCISRLVIQFYVNGSIHWTWYLLSGPVMEEAGLRFGVLYMVLKHLSKFCLIATIGAVMLIWMEDDKAMVASKRHLTIGLRDYEWECCSF